MHTWTLGSGMSIEINVHDHKCRYCQKYFPKYTLSMKIQTLNVTIMAFLSVPDQSTACIRKLKTIAVFLKVWTKNFDFCCLLIVYYNLNGLHA